MHLFVYWPHYSACRNFSSPTRDWIHASLHWKPGVLTAGLPGKSRQCIKKKVYWSTVDLQCYVSFCCTKMNQFSLSLSLSLVKILFPTCVMREYWGEFLVLCSRSLLVIHFIEVCTRQPQSPNLSLPLPFPSW